MIELVRLLSNLADCPLGEYNTCEVKFEDLEQAIEYLKHYDEIRKIVADYVWFYGYRPESLAEYGFEQILSTFKEKYPDYFEEHKKRNIFFGDRENE